MYGKNKPMQGKFQEEIPAQEPYNSNQIINDHKLIELDWQSPQIELCCLDITPALTKWIDLTAPLALWGLLPVYNPLA